MYPCTQTKKEERAYHGPVIRKITLPDTAYKIDHKARSAYAGCCITLAFFGLLSISEFTVSPMKEFNPCIHATRSSVHLSRNHYTFYLSRSKTDQYGHGQDIYIPQVTGKLCPFAAMTTYLKEQGQTMPEQTTPLFVFASGKPLSRSSCLKYLHTALSKMGYNP